MGQNYPRKKVMRDVNDGINIYSQLGFYNVFPTKNCKFI